MKATKLQTATGQDVLIQALASVVLPRFQQPASLVRREDVMLFRIEQAKLDKRGVRHVATIPAVLGDQWQFIPGVGALDWALMRLDNCPLYRDPTRGMPIPQEVLNRLHAVQQAGLQFDDLWIAHEIRKGRVRPGQTLTAADLLSEGPVYRQFSMPRIVPGVKMGLNLFGKLGMIGGYIAGMLMRPGDFETKARVAIAQTRPLVQEESAPVFVPEPVVQEEPIVPPARFEPVIEQPIVEAVETQESRLDEKEQEAERLARLEEDQKKAEARAKAEAAQREEEREREAWEAAQKAAAEVARREEEARLEAIRQAEARAKKEEEERRRREAEEEWERKQLMKREIKDFLWSLHRPYEAVFREEQTNAWTMQQKWGGRVDYCRNGDVDILYPGEHTWTNVRYGDPILFGVLVEAGVSSLYYLGHWFNP